MLKLQAELKPLENFINENKSKILEYAEALKASKNFKVFSIRLAWGILDFYSYQLTGKTFELACKWYNKYNCNDNHIQSLLLKALQNTGIIES